MYFSKRAQGHLGKQHMCKNAWKNRSIIVHKGNMSSHSDNQMTGFQIKIQFVPTKVVSKGHQVLPLQQVTLVNNSCIVQ